jgi:hypothetical protein
VQRDSKLTMPVMAIGAMAAFGPMMAAIVMRFVATDVH